MYRSDDAVGLLIARRLKENANETVCVLEQSGDGTALMSAWANKDHVVVVDAVSSGQAPGTIHSIDAIQESIPSRFFSCSTHNLGIAEAVELGRTLDQLPDRLQIFGIEGKNFEPGEGLSAEVEQAMEKAIGAIIKLTR